MFKVIKSIYPSIVNELLDRNEGNNYNLGLMLLNSENSV